MKIFFVFLALSSIELLRATHSNCVIQYHIIHYSCYLLQFTLCFFKFKHARYTHTFYATTFAGKIRRQHLLP